MTIDAAMKQLFINSYQLMEQEKLYNYQNYGKYPYKDRKNSVQIFADFNADAYSVNGLFVTEDNYTLVYPPEIIETVEQIVVGTQQIYGDFVTVAAEVIQLENGAISGITLEQARLLLNEYDIYQTVITRDYVEVESVEIQVMRYLFPFNCVPDELGRLKISF